MEPHWLAKPCAGCRVALTICPVNAYLPSMPELTKHIVMGLAVALVSAWFIRRIDSTKP